MDKKLIPSNIIDHVKRVGAVTFKSLYKKTHKQHKWLNEEHLNSILMKMEIQGLLRVYSLPKGKRRIELA